jgi:hypothetical protein
VPPRPLSNSRARFTFDVLCLVLSCLILSCLVMACLVVVLSYVVSFRLVLSHILPYHKVRWKVGTGGPRYWGKGIQYMKAKKQNDKMQKLKKRYKDTTKKGTKGQKTEKDIHHHIHTGVLSVSLSLYLCLCLVCCILCLVFYIFSYSLTYNSYQPESFFSIFARLCGHIPLASCRLFVLSLYVSDILLIYLRMVRFLSNQK